MMKASTKVDFSSRIIALWLLCAALLVPAHAQCAEGDSRPQIQVVDYAGRTVMLEKPAVRIVALAPHIVENLYSAGAGDLIVGAVDYCDFPEAAKKIPRVGAISAFSVEAIVALKPDLVVVWNSGRGAKYLDTLSQLGINVYASNPKTLEDVARSIEDYGLLTGRKASASQFAKHYRQQQRNLAQTYAGREPVSVFYEVWNSPLQTLNGDHIISDVIRMCGGKNIFADEPSVAPKVSLEAVIAGNPEAIVVSGMGEKRPEWLDDWKQYPSMMAVQRDNLFFVPPDIIQRHTARMLQGAELLCQQLDTARERRVQSNTAVSKAKHLAPTIE